MSIAYIFTKSKGKGGSQPHELPSDPRCLHHSHQKGVASERHVNLPHCLLNAAPCKYMRTLKTYICFNADGQLPICSNQVRFQAQL